MRIPELLNRGGQSLSLEFFPPKKQDDWPDFLETAGQLKVLAPSFVSVTYGAGGSTQDATLEICRQLMDHCSYEVMPHLTGVAADTDKIDQFLATLKALGVDNVLALRGDRPQGFSGDDQELFAHFPHASDLVSYVHSSQPEMAVGVAGFPEGHAECSSIAKDLEVMREKVESGASFVITQLYFDNRVYFDYVERLRCRGIRLPIIPGILPVRNLASLRFILQLCNARIPGQLINALLKADEEGGSKAVYATGVSYARQQIKELLQGGAPGVHLYTLNKADMCLEVMAGLY
ncbi:MAG: methylenetetrahydrofolate reductase [NAD(P)H] [Desulfobulbus propionicus]|nr:MAG: methylenetetrahydrofolate reductase [NAD(P)H] [Desulfobulbus propionicus]